MVDFVVAIIKDSLAAIYAKEESDGEKGEGVDVYRAFADWSVGGFCTRYSQGKVRATCSADSPYADSGGLNLKGNDRFLMRIYCFDDPEGPGPAGPDGAKWSKRAVLHVHTNIRWRDRHKFTKSGRVRYITQVNIRHAFKPPGEANYRQEGSGFCVVPVSSLLIKGWRDMYVQGKGDELQWEWNQKGSVPPLDKAFDKKYDPWRRVVWSAEQFLKQIPGPAIEALTLEDTEANMRGGDEYELVGVWNGEQIPSPRTMMSEMQYMYGEEEEEEEAFAGSVTVSDDARQQEPAPFHGKLKILFVGANAKGMREISTREECNKIREAFMSQWGKERWEDHVTIHDTDPSKSDLADDILNLQPHILHIACHGKDGCLNFDADVEDSRLKGLIGALNRHRRIRLAIVNACLSSAVAEQLSACVEFVVGHRDKLPDASAMHFSKRLYSSLAEGNSLEDSFLAGSGTKQTSYHLRARDTDPSRMFFFSNKAPQGLALLQDPTSTGTHRQMRQRPSVLINIRLKFDDVLRREALLKQLNDLVCRSKEDMVYVCGLGGCGKSTLVRMLLADVAGAGGWDLVAWLRADSLVEDYKDLALKLTSDIKRSELDTWPPADLRDNVHRLLEGSGGKWLIGIDEAEDRGTLTGKEGMLKGFPFNFGKTVLTCRSQKEWEGEGHGFGLPGFTEDEAVGFVGSRMASWKPYEDGVRKLVNKLERFPLAVSQCVKYCEVHCLETPDEYVEQLAQAWQDKQYRQWERQVSKGKDSDRYPYSFVQVVLKSVSTLNESDLEGSEAAISLLRKMSLLHTQDIPMELFTPEEKSSVELLLRQSLVTEDHLDKKDVKSMHALTQEVVRQYLMPLPVKRDCVDYLASRMRDKTSKIDVHKKATHFIGLRYHPHVRRMLQVMEAEGLLLTLPASTRPAVVCMCDNLAQYLGRVRCMYATELELMQVVLKVLTKEFSNEHVDVAKTYINMGSVYFSLGDYSKALEYHEKGLQIQLKKLGDEHVDVAVTYMNMGSVYSSLGDYSKALEYHEKGLQIQLKKLGDEHVDVASTYMNMGTVYESLGDYSKALEYHEKGLQIQLKKLGDEHVDVAFTYRNMGSVYSSLGDYSKALEYHEKGLQIQLKKLGDEHVDVASTYINMGSVYSSLGDYSKALEYHEKGLQIQLKKLGDEHVDVASTYINMGNVYLSLGDYSKALEYHEKGLQIQLKKLGDEHVDVASTYKNMGSVYLSLGDYSKALEYHEKGLQIQLKKLGDEHVDVARTYMNMGSVYSSLGDYSKALEYHEKGLQIQLKKLGDEHVDVASTHDSMGVVYMSLGQCEQALEFHGKALKTRLNLLGDEHVDVAASIYGSARVKEEQGDRSGAAADYRKAVGIWSKYGDHHRYKSCADCAKNKI